MTKKHTVESSIIQYMIAAVRNEGPDTVNQLVELVQRKYQLTEHEITKIIIQLQDEGKIRLIEGRTSTTPIALGKYLFSSEASWYWLTTIWAAAAAIAAFVIVEDAYPLVYVRYVLGAIFVLWLPGYAFIKALFPKHVPIKTSSESLDAIERIALSACMNLALVPILGLLLNYTPLGMRQAPMTLSLMSLIIVFATIAVVRECKQKPNKGTSDYP